jgi:hypothetical protein
VALGQHHGDREPHGVALALDDALDGAPDPGGGVGEGSEVGLAGPHRSVFCVLSVVSPTVTGSSLSSPAGPL